MTDSAIRDDTELVLSRYLVAVEISDDLIFCGHAVFGRRRLLDRHMMSLLGFFRPPQTPASAVAEYLRRNPRLAVTEGLPELVHRIIRGYVEDGILVPADQDEPTAVAERLGRTYGRDADGAFGVDAIEDAFMPVLPERLDRPSPAGDSEPLTILLLGWCAVQSLRPVLAAAAAARGFQAAIQVGFPDDVHLIDALAPDVTVLQLSHRLILAPVLDGLHLLPPEELEDRITGAEAAIRSAVEKAAARTGSRLLLVQGIAAPQVSPFGAADFRHAPNVSDVVFRLNRTAREATARHPDALFVDEEALAASFGKRWLMDDLVSTFSHHGLLGYPPGGAAIDAPADTAEPSEQPEPLPDEAQRTRFHRLMSGAYLDLYEIWRGRDAIRCVITDLDGTLWPGRIADESFDFNDERLVVPLMYGWYAGLHQALQVLRRRGIVLAAVSKNDPGVLAKWRPDRLPLGLGVRAEERGHLLRPDDFVAVRLAWEPKSAVIRRLTKELGVSPGQVAFIDDHPVEREEVRQTLPDVLVLGDDMARVREVLLTSPRFQVLDVSPEARRRTETTRARLEREAARTAAPDAGAFLKSLEVRCVVRVERDTARAARISELLRRTNQFATTAQRPSAAELAALMGRDGAAVVSLHVRDRFADYGLVGAAVVEGTAITAFAISCRVIGLEAEIPLLRRALELAGRGGGSVHVLFAPTERNLPARRLFILQGFSARADGTGFLFDLAHQPPPADPPHLHVLEE